jgi:hypothetical protein
VPADGDPVRMLWLLHLSSVVLPAALLLLLVRRLGDRLEAGLGGAAAVAVGLGTLLLPFGTLLFVHVLSATLAFAAFALLWRERDGPPRLRLLAVAGALAGLAVAVEVPLAFAALVLGAYAAARRGAVRRAAVFAGGLAAGVAPFLAYNAWAFGSPLHLPYAGAAIGGAGSRIVVDSGIYGVGLPDLTVAADLLLDREFGLLVPAPIVVVGLAALVLLFRRGRRAEAVAIGAIAVVYPLYVSGYVRPTGDLGPGPRYLIPVLPFLAVPVALAFRCAPATTTALAGASIVWMSVVTLTRPQAAWDGHVFDRLFSPGLEDYSRTATELVGVTGPVRIVPFVLAVAVAAAAAVLAARPAVHVGDLGIAAVALGAWAALALGAPALLRSDLPPYLAAGLAAALLVALAAAVGEVETWLRRVRAEAAEVYVPVAP